MTTLLVKNAYIVTMDDRQTEIPDGGLFIRDGFIEAVGPVASLPREADEILDLSGHIVLPGLVNTHHHFYRPSPATSLPRRMPTCSTGSKRFTPSGRA
jgi:cytosine/adenosine deaminase-related metal-dependent hydrolase